MRKKDTRGTHKEIQERYCEQIHCLYLAIERKLERGLCT